MKQPESDSGLAQGEPTATRSTRSSARPNRKSRAALEEDLRATRAALEKRMRSGALDGVTGQELQMALNAMDFLWEEISSLARLISRDRRRYARFFEHMPDAYVITTPDGRINEANRAAVDLLGVPGDKVQGQSLAAFLKSQERAEFLARLMSMTRKQALSRAGPWRASLHPAAGDPVPVALTLGAIQHATGKIAELCWLIRPEGHTPALD